MKIRIPFSDVLLGCIVPEHRAFDNRSFYFGIAVMYTSSSSNCHPTECLNLKKLEGESRILFLPGLLCGFLFFVLLLRCIPSTIHFPQSSEDRMHARRMTLTFVTLHPPLPHPAMTGEEKHSRISPVRERVPDSKPPESLYRPLEKELPASAPDSIPSSHLALLKYSLPDSGSPRVFPNLVDSTAIILRTPEAIAARENVFHELERRFGNNVERREPDIPPIPGYEGMAYLRSSPGDIFKKARDMFSAGHRLVKKMHGNRKSAHRKNEMKASENGIRMVSGPELRFLILLWRDGQIAPELLSHRDREFISGGGPTGAYSHRELLSRMEEDGLVVSIQKDDDVFYRAKCTRMEILQALSLHYSALLDSGKRDTILESIDLITRCTDLSSGRVFVPDASE